MASHIAVSVPLENIQRVQIYLNTSRKSLSAIKKATGADYILNGTLYEMASGKVVCHLKVDGEVIAKPDYTVHGYGWDEGSDISMMPLPSPADNYIACTALIVDGAPLSNPIYNAAQGGLRGRSAIGMKDGFLCFYCSKDGSEAAKTPEQLRDLLFSYGWTSAVMLDGGGSSQCDFAGEAITSTRKVQHLILVYLKKEESIPMTENQLRQKVVSIMQGWLGWSESNGKHKKIIDIYNSHKPLARGYKVQYSDEWCATAVSAAFIQAGLTDIAPTECSCGKMLELYKQKGCWQESDTYRPSPGDLILYDWQDSGTGDNAGYPDHIGIVEKISGNTMTIIEGNKNTAVERRTMAVGARFIRGYCLPSYSKKAAQSASVGQTGGVAAVSVSVLKDGSQGTAVKALQILLGGYGFSCEAIDGDFGPKTLAAVKKFQTAKALVADGVVGQITWSTLLGK